MATSKGHGGLSQNRKRRVSGEDHEDRGSKAGGALRLSLPCKSSVVIPGRLSARLTRGLKLNTGQWLLRFSVLRETPMTSAISIPFQKAKMLHRRRGAIMKVRIDYDLCMGDRNCNKVCPDVFQYDEDKMISRVLMNEVPKHLEALVRKAAKECAPGAIIVEE